MPNAASALFRTVSDGRHLGFWTEQTFHSDRVAQFLDLKKADVAKITGVSRASVRFDQKIPKEVFDRLQEIANICELVAQYYAGDISKTALWFKTPNPLLGNASPRDMIRFGRYEKLRRFIMDALAENAALPTLSTADTANTSRDSAASSSNS